MSGNATYQACSITSCLPVARLAVPVPVVTLAGATVFAVRGPRGGALKILRVYGICALAYLTAGVPAYVKALCPSHGPASLVAEFSDHGACSGVAGIWRVARVSFYDHDALGITGDLRARLRHLA